MSDEARKYIQGIRAKCKAALKRGEQIGFFDALAISRPTGEQAVYWMLPEIARLQIELKACVAHHDHTLDIIEKALGEDRHRHDGVWLAESIALDIHALRSASDQQRANLADIGKKYADALTFLNWICNCWPGDDENWYRSDMDDCVGAIRKFLFCNPNEQKE